MRVMHLPAVYRRSALSTAAYAKYSNRNKASSSTAYLLPFAASIFTTCSLFTKYDLSFASDEPKYSPEEVAKHKTKDARIWVSYNGGVYDVTEFIDLHPGGKDKIALAAGSALEPFWTMYTQHKKDFV
jgi:cytochrome b involved in lipid metabolism